MFFSPIALQFNPFPFYPLHAPQAGPQKTLQICVLLLQVASLGDFSGTSGFILTTFPKIRFMCGDILMYQMLFWRHLATKTWKILNITQCAAENNPLWMYSGPRILTLCWPKILEKTHGMEVCLHCYFLLIYQCVHHRTSSPWNHCTNQPGPAECAERLNNTQSAFK